MRAAKNRRDFLNALNEMDGASSPSQLQLIAVTQTLSRMITDLTGKPCELLLRFPEPEQATSLPGQIDMGEVWEVKS